MPVKARQFAATSLRFGFLTGAVIASLVSGRTLVAEPTSADQLAEQVMQNESHADTNDHSRWIYRDQMKTPGRETVQIVVETPACDVAKTIEIDGHALNSQQRQQDDDRITALVNTPARQERARRASEHDDQQAHDFMRALPTAFLWTESSRDDSTETLDFKPNPAYRPTSREMRVLGAMSGQMVVGLKEKRLESLSGHLIAPVDFGWGLLGKLRKGGTFRIERREIAPGEWQTTETHVHIQGKALLFKKIEQQEDEVTSGYKPAPQSLSLAEAADMLRKDAIQPGP
jgi:hypothetical protein